MQVLQSSMTSSWDQARVVEVIQRDSSVKETEKVVAVLPSTDLMAPVVAASYRDRYQTLEVEVGAVAILLVEEVVVEEAMVIVMTVLL
jgi:hypothetical protein